jgi:hypothetical protein
MTIALIAIGVVVFLLVDGYILMKVFKGHKGADDYGSIQIPGSTQLTLPAGKVKLTYQESKKSSSSEHEIHFSRPDSLVVTVTPATGAGPLEINGPGFRGMGSSKSTKKNMSRDLIGSVEVTSPGVYTIAAEGTTAPDAVAPIVLIGK